MTIIRRKIPPLLTTRELFHLVCLIVGVIVLLSKMDTIRNPKSWEWMFGTEVSAEKSGEQDGKVSIDVVPVAENKTEPAVDARVIEKSAPLQDSFEKKEPAKEAPVVAGRGRQQVNPLALSQIEECKEPDLELLKQVRDKTGTQPEDKLAIHQLACVAATTPEAELFANSRKDLLFANIFNESDRYRGHLVHFQGVLARLTISEKKEFTNPYGIGTFYEAWIFPEDQRTNPLVFLFTKLPPGLQPGHDLKETVSFDGFYVKLRAYRNSQQKLVSAPLLVGYTLTWNPRGPLRFGSESKFATAVIVGILLLGGMLFYWTSRRDKKHAVAVRSTSTDTSLPDFLNEVHSTDSTTTTSPPP